MNYLFEVAEFFGIIAFALSGFYMAVREKLDLLGIFIAAFLTALGGGITRDTIAGKMPYTFTHLMPTLLVIGVVVIAILLKLKKHDKFEQTTIFVLSDTLGLVSFAIAGTFVGIEVGFNIFGIVMLSLITAVGGSCLRDILLNKIPFFLTSDFYATIAIIVSLGMYALNAFGVLNIIGTAVIFVIGVFLRLLAYYKKWKLPTIG
ncbi:MAG: TRIC cation channel family protein [Campylobacteraceae bacterium]|nr:TRIC cation channel family protein [Campylobacteraceae bacterium]